jgi:hypothetical protein
MRRLSERAAAGLAAGAQSIEAICEAEKCTTALHISIQVHMTRALFAILRVQQPEEIAHMWWPVLLLAVTNRPLCANHRHLTDSQCRDNCRQVDTHRLRLSAKRQHEG